MSKTINARIINKHDIEANWKKATNFSPMAGEIIVYDIDENYNYERIKIGDGTTNVNDLPFSNSYLDKTIETLADQINKIPQRYTIISNITLPSSGWVGDASPYSQTIEIDNITDTCIVDLQPTIEQITDMQNYNIGLTAVNDNSVITIYAFNNKPTVDYSMQISITDISTNLPESGGDRFTTIEFEPVNIFFNESTDVTVGAIWDRDGTAPTITQYTVNYNAYNTLIECIGDCTYSVPNYIGLISLYDKNKAYIQTLDLTANGIANYEFTTPANSAFMGVSYLNNGIDGVEAIYRLTPSGDEETGGFSSEFLSVLTSNIKNADAKSLLAPLKGKTIVNFGDSIFGNARPPYDISTRISKLTGATVHNCGFGGCRMASHPDANYDAFGMTKLADAITSGNFILQETALTNTEASVVPNYFADNLTTLKSMDFAKVDIITIAYGTNDWTDISLESENKDSFAGALRYSIETILTKYPNIKIFICSPTYRFWMDNNGAFTEDSDTNKGYYDYTIAEMVEKAREVAKEYKLPFVDNYFELGINKFNRQYYFPSDDGTHHNLRGRNMIAEHIAKKLF